MSFREAEGRLHEAAARTTGLEDFGDTEYLEGLRTLLGALDDESELSGVGLAVIEGMIVGALQGRLRSEQGFSAHPEAREVSIERPLVITGLARTGTSALHHLLAQDPALQGLELWLAHAPKPRPPRAEWPGDTDFSECDARMRALYERSPEMRAIHYSAADQVDECWYLLAQSFAHSGWEANTHVPTYSKWWAQHDMTPAYRRHRRNLQLIGLSAPDKRWLLKDSTHLFDLNAFLSTYPDALVVQTHRDPARVIPSTCSLCWSARAPVNENPDPEAFGRSTLDLWQRGVEASMQARRGRDPAQFYDLQFEDFQRDPLAAIADIYDHFSLPMAAAAESAMAGFRHENPRGKHGEHRVALSDWGLEADEIRGRFRTYIDLFRIPPEG